MKTPSPHPSPADFADPASRQPSQSTIHSNAAQSEAAQAEANLATGVHSLFQIAAHVEIPGLPRMTIRRLTSTGNESAKSESARSKTKGNKRTDAFKDLTASRTDSCHPEHEIWSAALSLSLGQSDRSVVQSLNR
jgi:hypothetical protein